MPRHPHRTAAGLLGVITAFLPHAGSAQPPAFPTQAERVIVDVIVTDGQDVPVSGLVREDFVVQDEGAVQDIVDFEAVDVVTSAGDEGRPSGAGRISTNDAVPAPGRTFLILFDDLHLSPGSGDRVRRALQRFLERQLRDADCVTVAPTAGGAWWSGCLGDDRSDLDAALGAMRGRRLPDTRPERMSDYEAMRIEADHDREAMLQVALRFAAYGVAQSSADLTSRDAGRNQLASAESAYPLVRTLATEVYQEARTRNETMLRSVERAMRSLAGGRGRRIVILASDGFVRDTRLQGSRRVREAARRANAALYFLDAYEPGEIPGRGMTDQPALPDPDNLLAYASIAREYAAEESAGAEELADDTGGFTVRGSDLDRGLGRITAESRVFYLLGYAPSSQGRDGRFRRVKVSVRRPGLKVRARSGYYAGTPPAEKSRPDAPTPLVRHALDSPADVKDLPLRMTTYVLGNVAGGRIAVLLTAEADPASVTLTPKDGRLTGAVSSYSSLAARDTGEVGQKDLEHELALRPEAMPGLASTWLPIAHVYELSPGRYQARLVVTDRGSGRMGSVRHAFDVPRPEELRLTTPVLTDALAPGGAPDAPARPLPVARRSFAVGSRLVCGVEVWGGRSLEGQPPTEITYEVRRADGSVVVRSPPKALPRDATGARADVFKMTLNRAGEYELRLRARDPGSGEEASAVDRFQVVAAAPEP